MNFEPAVRRNVPLIIGIAGPSGGGKTYSALRLARGLAGGGKIAAIDTERGRMLHYADEFDFLHAELDAPFSPDRYAEAIKAALAIGPAVVLVDSFSHEWAGDGGVIDMQEAELDRMAGNDWKKREAVRFASWIKPKGLHKTLVNDVITRMPCHLIVCLRAEDRVEMKKDPKTGKLEVVPKRTLSGHEGWIPVTGKEVAYELTVSVVVTPDKPGVPQPVKIQAQHIPLVPLDRPLDESVGEALAAWARGTTSDAEPSPTAAHPAEGAGGSGNEPAPSASDTDPEPPAIPPVGDSGNTVARSTRHKPITAALSTKLGMLIGQVRDDAGAVTTADLYRKLAEVRGVDLETLRASIPEDVRDADGVLRIGPALKTLTRAEGHALIDWLAAIDANAKTGAAA